MTVLFYTATYYLDISLEVINVLKSIVELHVLIEIHPTSKNLNIVEVDCLPVGDVLVKPSQLLNQENYKYMQPYFEGTASVHFVVYPHSNFSTLLACSSEITRFIKKIKPQILHIEAFSVRSVTLLPAIKAFKKIIITVHDPVPHSGEKNWKESLIKSIFSNLLIPKHYLFYSNYARSQFQNFYPKIKSKDLSILRMSSYSYFKQIQSPHQKEKKHILFFGRISKYKGIEVLLKAMPNVFSEFPNEHLVIAGKSVPGYMFNDEVLKNFSKNITLINRYISNKDLVDLLASTKFVVCPYLDASQSGVLMTAFALNVPVIATNVGAFPEYINEGHNGLLVCAGDPEQLSKKIRECLHDNNYQKMEIQIAYNNQNNNWNSNLDVLKITHHLK